jgi:hypothetical protein
VAFQTPFDIANRGLQHLGAARISAFSGSRNADEAGFVYDKAIRAELRANPWNFARRRAVLRQLVAPFFINFAPWSSTTAYAQGDIVSFTTNNGTYPWLCGFANTGVSPLTADWFEYAGANVVPAWSAAAAPYFVGELTVLGSAVYLSMINVNTATPGTDSTKWHPVAGAIAGPSFIPTPLGYTTNLLPASSKSVFPLPQAYLRNMMQDPKTQATPAQITTGGSQFLDYEIEHGLLLTAATGPLIFRYGAYLQLVPWYDDMFCEMVALRIALSLSEVVTQKTANLTNLNALYNEALDKAILVNAIEAGSTEPSPGETKMSRNPALEKPQQQPRQQGRGQ